MRAKVRDGCHARYSKTSRGGSDRVHIAAVQLIAEYVIACFCRGEGKAARLRLAVSTSPVVL